MATFKRFEDIQAWQKARIITVEIYRICGQGGLARDFDLRSQIRRSSASVMANIPGGQGRRTDRDFAHFLNIALGSVAETKSHLYLALDLDYIPKPIFQDIYVKLNEVGKMIYGLISHLRSNEPGPTRKTSETSQTDQTS